MRVLIVHYHLKPGGVTTVIRRQASALKNLGFEVQALVGEAPGTESGTVSGTVGGLLLSAPLVVEPALAYDQAILSNQSAAEASAEDPRIKAIVSAVESRLGPPADDALVHVHNPTIRKNSALIPALSILASRGYALILHVHDLAEDWRPDVYYSQEYPQGASWVCINQRDTRNLKTAGAGKVYFLPNAAFSGPVSGAGRESPQTQGESAGERFGEPSGKAEDQARALILYPVRGIRRKNLGEAVLLSLFLPPGFILGITLPPNNPRDLPYYQGWKAAAGAFQAPLRFELGLSADLDEWYGQAKAVVSTSIKEGFGLSFLEPLARGRAVLGRRLSSVIDDFEEKGLSFPDLYSGISVPEEFFDHTTFLNRIRKVVLDAARVYGFEGGALVEALGQTLSSYPDFGRLDETAQAETLSRIAFDTGARSAFLAANPFLETWWEPRMSMVAPASLEPWSEDVYGTRLAELYQTVRESGGGSPPDKAALLALYLNPEGFYGVGI